MSAGFERPGRIPSQDEASISYRRLLPQTSEGTSLRHADAPIRIRLGYRAVDTLLAVEAQRDLSLSEQRSLDEYAPEAAAFLIQPTSFDASTKRGVLPLFEDMHHTVGRSSSHQFSFEPFTAAVSRRHARIGMSRYGLLHVADLSSLNGTFIGLQPARLHPERQSSQEQTEPQQAWSASIKSEQHKVNEDSLVVEADSQLYGVFDGVGGSINGAFASRVTSETLTEHSHTLPDFADPQTQGAQLTRILLKANTEILRTKQGKDAQTTAVAAKVYTAPDGNTYATIASCGDSRAYLLRDDILTALTTDHTPHRTLWGKTAAKELQQKLATTDTLKSLSEELAWQFHNRNTISKALGCKSTEAEDIDIEHVIVLPGDLLVLTTDGVHDNLTNSEIHAVLARHRTSDRIADELTKASKNRSKQRGIHDRAKADDITAVIVEI